MFQLYFYLIIDSLVLFPSKTVGSWASAGYVVYIVGDLEYIWFVLVSDEVIKEVGINRIASFV